MFIIKKMFIVAILFIAVEYAYNFITNPYEENNYANFLFIIFAVYIFILIYYILRIFFYEYKTKIKYSLIAMFIFNVLVYPLDIMKIEGNKNLSNFFNNKAKEYRKAAYINRDIQNSIKK